MVNVQSGTWDSWVGISFTIPVGGPKTILTGVKIGKPRPSSESKDGTFSLSCNTINIAPFRLQRRGLLCSQPAVRAALQSYKRAMKWKGRNQKGEQPNATAFTQVSHLLRPPSSPFQFLPTTSWCKFQQGASGTCPLLHNNCCCFVCHFPPSFFPLSLCVLDVRASNTSK